MYELTIITNTCISVQMMGDNRTFTAKWVAVELIKGGQVAYAGGCGFTKDEAVADLCARCAGQRCVVDAYKPTRREFQVPDTLVPK